MMAVCAVLTIVGLGLIITWLVAGASIWLLIVGLLMLLFGPAGIAMGIVRLKSKERLIVGDDRFQIVQSIKGKDVVVTQIPYTNMARLEFERSSQSNFVGIDIEDLDEADTYQKNDNFSTMKSIRKFHCIIDPGYSESIETIFELLAERFRQYREVADA